MLGTYIVYQKFKSFLKIPDHEFGPYGVIMDR